MRENLREHLRQVSALRGEDGVSPFEVQELLAGAWGTTGVRWQEIRGSVRPDPPPAASSPDVINWRVNRRILSRIIEDHPKDGYHPIQKKPYWKLKRRALRKWLREKLQSLPLELAIIEEAGRYRGPRDSAARKAKMRWLRSKDGAIWRARCAEIVAAASEEVPPQGEAVGVDLMWMLYRFSRCQMSVEDMEVWADSMQEVYPSRQQIDDAPAAGTAYSPYTPGKHADNRPKRPRWWEDPVPPGWGANAAKLEEILTAAEFETYRLSSWVLHKIKAARALFQRRITNPDTATPVRQVLESKRARLPMLRPLLSEALHEAAWTSPARARLAGNDIMWLLQEAVACSISADKMRPWGEHLVRKYSRSKKDR